MPAAHRWYQQLQQHFADAEVMAPVEGKAPVARLWCEVTFFDFAAGFRFGGKVFNPDTVAPRKRPAIVGHRHYSPDLQPEEFYYSKLLLYLRWVEPGDWLTEAAMQQRFTGSPRTGISTPPFCTPCASPSWTEQCKRRESCKQYRP